MRRNAWMTVMVVLGAIAGSLLTQRAGWTRSFGNPVADTLLTAAPGTGGNPVLLSIPGPQEALLAGQVATSGASAAEQERMRKALTTTKAYFLDAKGQIAAADSVPQIVTFTDPSTGEELQLELIAVQSGDTTHYVVRPDAPPLLENPANSDLSLLERNAAVFLLDTGRMSVKLLGNPAARSSLLAEVARLQEDRNAAAAEDGVQPIPALNWGQEPHWSLDGRYVAFLSNRDLVGEQLGNSVWVHELATERDLLVHAGQAGQHLVVRGWTPDNELIVDEYTRINGNASRARIVALKLDGSRRTLIAGQGRFVAQSPDGRTLIFLQQRRGRPNELRALDLAGGRQTTIWQDTPTGLHLRSLKVEFSANGQRLVTDLEDARNNQRLLIYNLRTGQTRVVPVHSGWQLGLPPSWVGNRLLLPLERKGAARTFLLNPDEH
jgi:WD40-like Beta Propeller Repeat